MKRIYLMASALCLVFASCQQSQDETIDNSMALEQEELSISKDQCGTMGVLEDKIVENPGLVEQMAKVEQHTEKALERGWTKRIAADGKLEIPVVFHVIYNSESENIPLSQLEDQIVALNEDFNLNNPGRNSIPAEFSAVESNIGIRFVLEDVIRVKTKKRQWRPDDSMKFSSSDGSDVVNPQEFLNFWVVSNMPYRGGNILGYAQFPGGSWATDGVVMDHRFTGTTQYSTGRTATHEVGHWLNLRHIWGDGGCGATDYVDDTPDSDGPSRGCPSYPTVNCGTADMTMNFMDYSDDPCLNMFTEGQKSRMLSVFTAGGFREAMAN